MRQSAAPPPFLPNLPVSTPLWADFEIESDVDSQHRDVVALVVSGSGVCGSLPVASRPWTLRLQVSEIVDAANPTDLLCGLTLFTFPSLRWRDLVVAGSLVDAEGQERATAKGQSTVLTVISWPFALFAQARDPDDELLISNYRALTRHVIANLVHQHEQLKTLVAIDRAIESEVDAAGEPVVSPDPTSPPAEPAPPPAEAEGAVDPLRGDTNQPPRDD